MIVINKLFKSSWLISVIVLTSTSPLQLFQKYLLLYKLAGLEALQHLHFSTNTSNLTTLSSCGFLTLITKHTHNNFPPQINLLLVQNYLYLHSKLGKPNRLEYPQMLFLEQFHHLGHQFRVIKVSTRNANIFFHFLYLLNLS